MDLVAVAKLVKTRGLKGELAADLLTDFPERFEQLADVTAVMPDGSAAVLKIEDYWFQKGRIVLKFEGYDSIDNAETLRGAEICVAESEAVDLDDGEYFDWQLEGCRVETLDGTNVGVVTRVMRNGGTELLVIKNGDRERLVPFAETICPDVDVENKLIRIDPPHGLLEF